MDIFENLKNANTDTEILNVLNDWYKKSELISVNQYLQEISNNVKKIEIFSGYLSQEDVNVSEIMNACGFIKAQLDNISSQVQEREATKNSEEEKMMFVAAKKLVSIGKYNEGYKALYNLSKSKTEVGKQAYIEANRILNNRKSEIERANVKKENTTAI